VVWRLPAVGRAATAATRWLRLICVTATGARRYPASSWQRGTRRTGDVH